MNDSQIRSARVWWMRSVTVVASWIIPTIVRISPVQAMVWQNPSGEMYASSLDVAVFVTVVAGD